MTCLSTGSLAVCALSNRRRPKGSEAQGFTLIEVLVAFAILAVSLAALMRVLTGGLGSLESAQRHATATLLARSVIERIGVEFPLAEGDFSGDAAGDFTWRAELRQTDAIKSVAGGNAVLYQPYEITVAVSWHKRPLLALHTLRFAARSDATAERAKDTEESAR